MLTTILATVVVLGVLIFVHELGHFVTAKLVDIEVPRFSIGFGPKVIGFRRGETEYVISALPLGGYVKMAGMEEMEAIEGGAVGVGEKPEESAVERIGPRPRRPRDFESKSLPARTLVISAGVIMNLLFALVVFTISAAVWGVMADPGTTLGGITEERLPQGAETLTTVAPGARVTAVNDRAVGTWRELTLELTRARAGETRLGFENAAPVTFALPEVDSLRGLLIAALEPALPVPPVLAEVLPDGPAQRAGLRAGDRIVQAGGRDVSTWQQFVAIIEKSPGQPVSLVVSRDDQQLQLAVTPRDTVLANGIRVGRISVNVPNVQQYVPRTRPTPLQAAARGVEQTWDVGVLTVDFLAGLFSGRQSPRNIGGAITIGQLSGRFARAGLQDFLGFMAILSINLAILNLLPIPVLDGGHLVFLGIEAVRGRPLSFEQRMRLTQVGFVFIILLMAWALGNDILRQFGI
jgi:regulator of sigma E protease